MKLFWSILLILSLTLATLGLEVHKHKDTRDGNHCLFKGQRIAPGVTHEFKTMGSFECNRGKVELD